MNDPPTKESEQAMFQASCAIHERCGQRKTQKTKEMAGSVYLNNHIAFWPTNKLNIDRISPAPLKNLLFQHFRAGVVSTHNGSHSLRNISLQLRRRADFGIRDERALTPLYQGPNVANSQELSEVMHSRILEGLDLD